MTRNTEERLKSRLAVVEKQRDLAEETLTRVETERLEAVKERDAYRKRMETEQQQGLFDFARYRQHLEAVVSERDEARGWARYLAWIEEEKHEPRTAADEPEWLSAVPVEEENETPGS
jgi:hypothetical protein